jgi:CDP-glycerol glycerophosphotransferase
LIKNLVLLVKRSSFLYSLYFYVGTAALSILKRFVHPGKHVLLFVSYGGRQYHDSPKVLYEAICNDARFSDYELIWAFRDPAAIQLPGRGKKIKIDTLTYYKYALEARAWITNVAIERGLNFKGSKTFYLCTWHGSTLKKLWYDLQKQQAKIFVPKNSVNFDVLCAQSNYDIRTFSQAFSIDPSHIYLTGLPRNDVLTKSVQKTRDAIRKQWGVQEHQQLILYAPTYRDYPVESPFFHPEIWDTLLDKKYFLLYKGHHFASKTTTDKTYDNLSQVSRFADIMPLLMGADILISDYSSVFFDFSILERPMFCYAPDLETYQEKRGLYLDLPAIFAHGNFFSREEELIRAINTCDVEKASQATQKFKQQFIEASGNATESCLNLLSKEILREIPDHSL